MKMMTQRYRITFDSEGKGTSANAFIVHRPDGPVVFGTNDTGLYYHTAKPVPPTAPSPANATTLTTASKREVIWTTADAAEGMTRSDLKKAGTARRLQQMMAFPSDADYDGMVRTHMLRDCNIATRDITNAKSIFGPTLDAIRGKTVRQSPLPATGHYVSIPRIIRERNREVDISADVFFINGVPFIVTRSRRLRFITAEAIKSRQKKVLVDALKQVVNLYKCFGFHVHTCFADGEFTHLQHQVEGVYLDTTGHDEHVGDIERVIRVIKERVRSVRSSMPCTRVPRRIIIELVTFCVFWLNSFPPKGGVSRTYSPRTLLLGTTVSQRLH
jgi:hypothetical protein